MDAIPIFSQTKSAVQFICGQKDEARLTQENFSKQCPGVSQVRSIVECAMGNKKAAIETQKQCGLFMLNLINGIPVIGHLKGGFHYAVGDCDGGSIAMKAASHTTAAMAGGAVGFVVGGPVGAVAGGVAGGTSIDATITAVDSGINRQFTPYGLLEPLADPRNAGKWCDAAGGLALDGLTGRAAGSIVKRVRASRAGGRSSGRSVRSIPPEENLITRPVSIIGPCKLLIIKAHQGYLYLLKDGNLCKIKELILKYLSNRKESMNNTSHEDDSPFEQQQAAFGNRQVSSEAADSDTNAQHNSESPSTQQPTAMLNVGAVALQLSPGRVEVVQDGRVLLVLQDGQMLVRNEGSQRLEPLQRDVTYVQDEVTGVLRPAQQQNLDRFMEAAIRRDSSNNNNGGSRGDGDVERGTLSAISGDIEDDDAASVFMDALENLTDDDLLGVVHDEEEEEHQGLLLGAGGGRPTERIYR